MTGIAVLVIVAAGIIVLRRIRENVAVKPTPSDPEQEPTYSVRAGGVIETTMVLPKKKGLLPPPECGLLYRMPQETGLKYGVRSARVTDLRGRGLQFTMCKGGDDSWGAQVHPEFLLPDREIRFSFMMQGV